MGCHVWLLLPKRRPLPSSIFSARKQNFSTSLRRRGQLTPFHKPTPACLLTLQPRHHICLRSCLALLLKAVALSDKLSVERKRRFSGTHTVRASTHSTNSTEFYLINSVLGENTQPQHDSPKPQQMPMWHPSLEHTQTCRVPLSPLCAGCPLKTGICSASQQAADVLRVAGRQTDPPLLE